MARLHPKDTHTHIQLHPQLDHVLHALSRAGEGPVLLEPGAVRVLLLAAGANLGACANQLAGQPGAFFEEQASAALSESTSAFALRRLLSPRCAQRRGMHALIKS